MAKIGVKHFLVGELHEASDGTATYGSPISPGKAVTASVNINSNSAELYADDSLAESDYSFNSGDITLGIDNDDLETQAFILGHTITNGEMVSNVNDVSKYLGVGRIVTKIVNGARKYRVLFLNKTKFSEPSESDSTKGESVSFATHELPGKIHELRNGDWRKSKEFSTESEAVAYLHSLFGLTYTAEGFTSDGSATVTLAHAPAAISNVTVNGNTLSADSYSFTGQTVTFTATLTSGDSIVVAYTYSA